MLFVDLEAQQARIREGLDRRIKMVLDHGKYINGPEVAELEERMASFVGVKHAVGCSSGTDALVMALMAFGIGPGDSVITTPFTFTATAEAIVLAGARPVFVDIELETLNLDPDKLESAIRSDTRAVIAVDLFGVPAQYNQIRYFAKKRGLAVIEDAAQAMGAEYRDSKAGSLADIGCTSFFPAKPLGCYGDGGMCFTDNLELAERLQSIREHGRGDSKYETVRTGLNGRLDTLQAAVLLSKLTIFEDELARRQKVADRWTELLGGDDSHVTCTDIPEGCQSAWAQYSVTEKRPKLSRATIRKALEEAGIPTAIYYPKPLHLQPAFAHLGYRRGDFPMAEWCSGAIFSLPVHPYVRAEEQEKAAEVILNLK